MAIQKFGRGMRVLMVTVALAQALGGGGAWAVPTRDEAYRNDDLGVVVYRDSVSPQVFWFLPVLKPLTGGDGKTTFRKRARANGNTDYTFYLVPQFPNDLAEFIAHEIPGLHNRSQLRPIQAKRFGVQVRAFNVAALSDEVTDFRYLNQPQMVRLSLPAEDAADFDDLYSAAPGVPVNMAITFESEHVEKYLSIELTYKEVYDAMSIAASGRYTFTRAEIESRMAEYLGNKYLTIKSKGDIKMPEIVEKVISQCFTPALAPAPSRAGLIATGPGGSDGASASADVRRQAEAEERLLQRATNPEPRGLDANRPGGLAPASPRPGMAPAAGGAPIPALPVDLQFTFKRELSSRNEKFLFLKEEMTDAQEITVIPAYLTEAPGRPASRMVTPLEGKTVRVARDHRDARPLRTGVEVRPGDQWTLNAAFTLAAKSPYGARGLAYYRWDTTWPKVDGDLYYRVGQGQWIKVNGRALVGSDSFESGEIELYMDRSAIWEKLPESYRKPKMLGAIPAVFPFDRTYPEYSVIMSGRHVQTR